MEMRMLFLLDLENNEIEEIPTDAFADLHKLVFLKLNGNKIKKLQAPLLNHLQHLHTFSAIKNSLIEIDEKLFKNNLKLRWIYLAANQIEQLSIDFSQLKHLRAVDLRKNVGKCNFLVNIDEQTTVKDFQSNVTTYCKRINSKTWD